MREIFIKIVSDSAKNYEPQESLINLQGLKAVEISESSHEAYKERPAYTRYCMQIHYKHNLVLRYYYTTKEFRDSQYSKVLSALEYATHKELTK